MATPTLVLLHVSPWSERACWAFEHHRIAYTRINHVPVVGELRLRRLVGRREGPATVPVLLDGDAVIADSWVIAEYADQHGAGAPLLPAAEKAAIRRWNDLADVSMTAGRALISAALLASPAALDETLPPNVPSWIRRLLRPISRRGARWFARKYGARLDDLGPAEAAMRAGLGALRAALAGGRSTLLGEFSYADIVMASLLQGVMPVADRYIRLGPATRAVWTHAAMARDYADLIDWRDTLYHRHRRPR